MKAAQAELEKAFAGTETEKALRLNLENKLSEMKKRHEGDSDMAVVLEQKDRSGSYLCDADIWAAWQKGIPLFPSCSFIPPFSACSPTVRKPGVRLGWREKE